MQSAAPLAMAAFEADRAFAKVTRERRRDSLTRRLFRRCAECARLAVYDTGLRGAALPGVREIPLDAITGSLEPGRAADFDHAFRPSEKARSRWTRVWHAMQRGETLPPICVVSVGDAYAIQDGHHRVSVALARGNATIAAQIA